MRRPRCECLASKRDQDLHVRDCVGVGLNALKHIGANHGTGCGGDTSLPAGTGDEDVAHPLRHSLRADQFGAGRGCGRSKLAPPARMRPKRLIERLRIDSGTRGAPDWIKDIDMLTAAYLHRSEFSGSSSESKSIPSFLPEYKRRVVS